MSHSSAASKACISRVGCFLLFSLTGCPKNGGNPSPGDMTVASSDASAPTITLGAGQSGGANPVVKTGGSAQSVKLVSKTGSLNLLATAEDPESGVQAVEIWMTNKTTTCTPTCSGGNAGLPGKPEYESTSPKKNPGETGWKQSTLVEALNLSTQIPQGTVVPPNTLNVELVFFARARNNFGMQAQTPSLKVTWSEP